MTKEQIWNGNVAEWQWFRNVTCHDIYWDALQAEIDRIALLSLLKETAWPRA